MNRTDCILLTHISVRRDVNLGRCMAVAPAQGQPGGASGSDAVSAFSPADGRPKLMTADPYIQWLGLARNLSLASLQ